MHGTHEGTVKSTMDLDKMNGVAAANGQDLEQARRGQDLPPSNRLAIGHLIREVTEKFNELTTDTVN
jgi:hypothetical protein